MAESELLRSTAANHHDAHHDAHAHDVHADESNIHLPESMHEHDEHDGHDEHHEDDTRQKG